MKQRMVLFFISFSLLFLLSNPMFAQTNDNTLESESSPLHAIPVGKPANSVEANDIWNNVPAVLMKLLVLSVIFEVALTPVFKWRVFVNKWDKKGIKTPIIFLFALLVFGVFGVNIFKEILEATGIHIPNSKGQKILGYIMTALLIGGGSDGVFQIFRKLGIRVPRFAQTEDQTQQSQKVEMSNQTSSVQSNRPVKEGGN